MCDPGGVDAKHPADGGEHLVRGGHPALFEPRVPGETDPGERRDLLAAQPRRAASAAVGQADHLDVLAPLLRGERVPGSSGPGSDPADTAVPGATPEVPLLLGALGPRMLRLAGERTTGTITFLTGPRTIAEHVRPLLDAAAAGRPSPRVVVGVPVSATTAPDRVRAAAAVDYAAYAWLPSYAGVLEREGLSSPGGLVIAGDEDAIAAGIARYAAAGVTDLLVSPLGDAAERARTVAVLGRIARS